MEVTGICQPHTSVAVVLSNVPQNGPRLRRAPKFKCLLFDFAAQFHLLVSFCLSVCLGPRHTITLDYELGYAPIVGYPLFAFEMCLYYDLFRFPLLPSPLPSPSVFDLSLLRLSL